MKRLKSIEHAAMDRLTGHRPSALRAAGAAVMSGGAVAVVVFRVLRSTD